MRSLGRLFGIVLIALGVGIGVIFWLGHSIGAAMSSTGRSSPFDTESVVQIFATVGGLILPGSLLAYFCRPS